MNPIERVIAGDEFNMVENCYFENIVSCGHKPIRLTARSFTKQQNKAIEKKVKIDPAVHHVLKCHGGYHLKVYDIHKVNSPQIHLEFKDQDSWDKAITQIRAAFSPDAIVYALTTVNRENGMMVEWVRAATENGQKAQKLILQTVDTEDYKMISFQKQKKAAGDMWADTCKYGSTTVTIDKATCHTGAHSE